MSISGNLQTMELAELLQWVSQSGKTGMLRISQDHIQKQIYFRKGRIIATGSDNPTEQLGHFLVSQGYLAESKLAEAMTQQQDTGMFLGKILVTEGVISEEELQELLRRKAQESIFDMFSWSLGEFRFLDEEFNSDAMVPMTLEVPAVVMQGMERLDEWRRIRSTIPSIKCVVVSVGDLSDENLTTGEQHVLEMVNDDRSVEEICVETHSSEFFVCRTLFEKFQQGVVKIVQPRIEEIQPSSEALTTVEAETLLDIANACIKRADLPRALRHLRAARSLDPNGEDTETAIREAEERMRALMKEEGLLLRAVPKVTVTPEEVEHLRLSPEEGFVLSRIDGSYDIESILKISPLPPLEAQLVFRRLLLTGHIELDQGNS